jgi:hypothetical protein
MSVATVTQLQRQKQIVTAAICLIELGCDIDRCKSGESTMQFLGTLTGSLLGLLAILAGALFNAHLNRARDDRLRLEEARSYAVH